MWMGATDSRGDGELLSAEGVTLGCKAGAAGAAREPIQRGAEGGVIPRTP